MKGLNHYDLKAATISQKARKTAGVTRVLPGHLYLIKTVESYYMFLL